MISDGNCNMRARPPVRTIDDVAEILRDAQNVIDHWIARKDAKRSAVGLPSNHDQSQAERLAIEFSRDLAACVDFIERGEA